MKPATILLLVVCTPFPLSAQDGRAVDIQRRAVVRVGDNGSGIIVAVDPTRVRVLTARHVVDGNTARRDPQTHKPTDCTAKSLPHVTFHFERGKPYEATHCTTTDDHDVALLDVPIAIADNEVPTFKNPRVPLERPGSAVTFLAHSGGLAQGRIVWHKAVDAKAPQFEATGTGVPGGFSGGAAIDSEGRLLGIVIESNPTTTVTLRWTALADVLRSWGVTTNRLEDAVSEDPDPSFADDQYKPEAEGARIALRQYRAALIDQDPAALSYIYPSLGRSAIRSLFGDAVRIELNLKSCTDHDADRSAPNTMNCEYRLRVFRRTGRGEAFEKISPCYPDAKPPCGGKTGGRMKFSVTEDKLGTRWLIAGITEEPVTTLKIETEGRSR